MKSTHKSGNKKNEGDIKKKTENKQPKIKMKMKRSQNGNGKILTEAAVDLCEAQTQIPHTHTNY